MEGLVLFLRTKHPRKSSLEHERHIINAHKLQKEIDNTPSITLNPKTNKLNVVVGNKTYILKEDV